MSTSKGKKRVSNLIGSTVTAAASTILVKNTFPKVKVPDTFSGDRKKFKAYETEY
jgi:hypothetical protein